MDRFKVGIRTTFNPFFNVADWFMKWIKKASNRTLKKVLGLLGWFNRRNDKKVNKRPERKTKEESTTNVTKQTPAEKLSRDRPKSRPIQQVNQNPEPKTKEELIADVTEQFNRTSAQASVKDRPEVIPVEEVVQNPKPKSKEELVADVIQQLKGTSVEEFFKDRPEFIAELAEKAAALGGSEEFSICEGEMFEKAAQVTLHQQVLFCDDSGSMKDGNAGENRWTAQNRLIDRIVSVTTRILPGGEGIYLRYINKDIPETDSLQPDEIPNIIHSFQPSGYTQIGTTLRTKILEPLVYHKLPHNLTRPLLITFITVGAPTNETRSSFAKAISECGRKLVKNGCSREDVKFLIGQVGTAKEATAFLKELRNDPDIRNVVFVTTQNLDVGYSQWEKSADVDRWLIETLHKPIMRSESLRAAGDSGVNGGVSSQGTASTREGGLKKA